MTWNPDEPLSTPAGIDYRFGDEALLDKVKPLWEKLNRQHAEVSVHFGAFFALNDFSRRCAGLMERARTEKLRIGLVVISHEGRPVGYCISSALPGVSGEIDSIYLEPAFRGTGAADRLMEDALDWMTGLDVKKKVVTVVTGNERAFAFYARYGFYPRCALLEQRPE